jgi:hypothetical protein
MCSILIHEIHCFQRLRIVYDFLHTKNPDVCRNFTVSFHYMEQNGLDLFVPYLLLDVSCVNDKS